MIENIDSFFDYGNRKPDKMPTKIYATPRGTGTVSGIWVDMEMGDEPRGEYEYILAESVKEMKIILERMVAMPNGSDLRFWKEEIKEVLATAKKYNL